MVITIPILYIKGDYETDSQLAIVSVKGQGPFTANLTKVTGDGRATIKAMCKTINGNPGQKILMVENAAFDFNIGIYIRWIFEGVNGLLVTHIIQYCHNNIY